MKRKRRRRYGGPSDTLVVGTGLVRISPMELRNVERSEVLDIISTDPGILFVGTLISQPFNPIPEFHPAAPVDLGVEDSFDLMLDVTVDFDRRRRGFDAFRKGIGEVWFEGGDVEYRVSTAEVRGEAEGEGGAILGGSDNFERSEIFLC